MKKKCSRIRLVLWALLALCVVCTTCWTYVHRRVIRAAIRGEKLPECPHWLPEGLKNKLGV